MAVVLLVIVLGFALWMGKLAKLKAGYAARSQSQVSDDGFSQAGVSVSYSAHRVTINGQTYGVGDVRGLSFRSGSDSVNNARANFSHAIINVNDLRNPTYKIDFIKAGDAEAFIERLSIALEQAGGPAFR